MENIVYTITLVIMAVCILLVGYAVIVILRKDGSKGTEEPPLGQIRQGKQATVLSSDQLPVDISDEEASLLDDETTLIEELSQSGTSLQRKKEILTTLEATGAYRRAVEQMMESEDRRQKAKTSKSEEKASHKNAEDVADRQEQPERKKRNKESTGGQLYDLGGFDFAASSQEWLGVTDTNSTHHDRKKHSEKGRMPGGNDTRSDRRRTGKGRQHHAEFIGNSTDFDSGSPAERTVHNRRHDRSRDGHSDSRKIY